MEIVNVKIKDLKPAEYNPRMMNEKSAKDLEESITEFGLVDPIIVNSNKDRKNIIIGGHQRYNICKKMGFEELPVYYLDLPLEAEKELNLRLNKNVGEWDYDMLLNFEEELLFKIGFEKDDLKLFNDMVNTEDETYSRKVSPITYEPKGEKPNVKEIYNNEEADNLKSKIIKAKIKDKDIEEFLLNSCNRFTEFNYEKIAEFYANSDKKIQKLMEDLALVIIDIDKAIENGFTELSNNICNLQKDDEK